MQPKCKAHLMNQCSRFSWFEITLAVFIPQIAESYRLLTSNKEGKLICEVDGWVVGGVQLVVLGWAVWVAVCGAGDGGGAVCKIDRRVL